MNWAEAEFKTIDLGDVRLNRRIIKIVEALGLAPGRTIPQAFQSWSSRIHWGQACDLQFEKVFSKIDLDSQITNHKPDPNAN